MPSLPQVQLHGRAGAVIPSKDDNANNLAQTATWLQNNASPFNTPPPRGDSIESITDLLSGTSTAPSRHESHLPQILPQYQVRGFMETNLQNRQNQEFIPWMHHNTSPFDNTPPPLGDSVESISDLLCLNVPRGSLLGNSNPLSMTPSYNIPPRGYDFDANSSCQNGAGIKHSGTSQVRCEPQNMSTPRKVVQSSHLDMTPTSPLQTISPICPPLNSPPHYSNRSTPDEVALGHHSQSDSPNDSNTSKTSSNPSQNEMQYNSMGGFSNASYCPSTEQELANLHNLYALRHARPTDAELMVKLIEHTSWLLWAATLNSPEYKPEEISMFDKVPRLHRSPKDKEVSCTWSGALPPRIHKNPTYSCKVFLGGVPWDITEGALAQAFSRFGSIKVEWPGKDQAVIQPKGYNYIILETEKKVKALLDYCAHHFARGGNLYYRVSSRKMKSKEVQVIPWAISDSNCARASQKLDPQKTVFVGALHGMINAEALAKIMNDLFGGVIYAGLDTDKYKYPIGSGRVTFSNYRSYMKAVVAAFIEVKTEQFSKKVQVDPYLEDASCSACNVQQGPYFCREMVCFRYYCRGCWALHHMNEGMRSHKFLTRNSKNSSHHITPFCTHLH